MDRYHLKGEQADRVHAVLCAAGYYIRWLLRMMARKVITFVQSFFVHAARQRTGALWAGFCDGQVCLNW